MKLKVNTFQIYKQIVSSRSCFWPNVGQMKSSQDIILSIPTGESQMFHYGCCCSDNMRHWTL